MGEKIKEMFPLCDEEGNFTGELKERSAVHRDGDLHGGSHIWIMERHDGRIRVLLQKRSDDKDSFPGCYDCSCAGHVDAGESFISTAVRELSEELSVKADEAELEFLFKQRVGGEYIFTVRGLPTMRSICVPSEKACRYRDAGFSEGGDTRTVLEGCGGGSCDS